MGSRLTPASFWGLYCNLAWQGTRIMLDSQQVIALRLAKIALGGAAAEAEALLMVNEKIAAFTQSQAIAGRNVLRSIPAGLPSKGGSAESARQILNLYQRKVASNRRRLSRA